MIWLKVVHFAAIAFWSAGLICLPAMYVRRAHIRKDESLHRLQAIVRFFYVGILSPAAYLAIASGIGLIFLRQVFEPWFSFKLGLVGVLAVIHILTGLVIIRLFDEGYIYPVWRFIAVTLFTVFVVTSIFTVVLAKPRLPDMVPDAFQTPGALPQLLRSVNPFVKS